VLLMLKRSTQADVGIQFDSQILDPTFCADSASWGSWKHVFSCTSTPKKVGAKDREIKLPISLLAM